MKSIILLVLIMGVLSSCTRPAPCLPTIHAKAVHSKHLRSVRHRLRVKYRYHQTKVGRMLNFNLF